MNNKKITRAALSAALAVVLGYVETLIPLPIPVPGVKLGLSNLAILYTLRCVNAKAAAAVMLVKVTVSALLFSGFNAFLYSLAGGILSLAVMYILNKSDKFSIYGISAAGGVFHNIGQLIAATAVLKSLSVFWYMLPLTAAGIITGIFIGIIYSRLIRCIKDDPKI